MIGRSTRRTQRGQGLLLLMLVMLVAGAAVLLEGIGSRASIRASDDEVTTRALALAKEALIAYAVTDSNRPGELPCPDANRDGVIMLADDLSGSNCRTLRGWLPWRTLDIEDVRDGSGARLWYALSDAFHANGTTPINPDTEGGLTVDAAGATDIVAVIIAPGEARAIQSRPADPPLGAPDADTHVAEYLEDGNMDGDQAYVTSGGVNFNDRVVYITADELLRAVERRVLAEVAISLRAYSASWEGTEPIFPWLKVFEDPRTAADFHGIAGQTAGLLPMHAPGGGSEAFSSPWSLLWSGLTTTPDFATGTVTAAVLQNGPAGGIPLPESVDNCTWFAGKAGRSRCSGAGSVATSVDVLTLLGYPVISYTRTYTFSGIDVPDGVVELDNDAEDSDPPSRPDLVVAPTAAEVRTRTVTATPGSGSILVSARIEVEDEVVLDVLGVPVAITSGEGRLTLSGATNGMMTIAGTRYWLDPARELPPWFTANEWYRFVFAAASPANLGDGGLDCSASGTCLSLLAADGSLASDDVGMAVMGAGPALTGQIRTPPPASLDGYLEQENADAMAGGDTVANRAYVPAFNDQVRIVEPIPSSPPPPPPSSPVPPPVQPS